MKSGEDFRRAMGQADDGFVKVITQVLSDLRVPKKRTGRRASAVVTPKPLAMMTRDV